MFVCSIFDWLSLKYPIFRAVLTLNWRRWSVQIRLQRVWRRERGLTSCSWSSWECLHRWWTNYAKRWSAKLGLHNVNTLTHCTLSIDPQSIKFNRNWMAMLVSWSMMTMWWAMRERVVSKWMHHMDHSVLYFEWMRCQSKKGGIAGCWSFILNKMCYHMVMDNMAECQLPVGFCWRWHGLHCVRCESFTQNN